MTLEEARAKALLLGARIRTSHSYVSFVVRYDWIIRYPYYVEASVWFPTVDEAFEDLLGHITRGGNAR